MAGTAAVPQRWAAIDFRREVRDAVVAGRRVRYLDHGDGPPLVLLHGMACCWEWWLEVVPELGRHHRVLAVDLPGFGRSDALPPPAEMAEHATVVLGLLQQLGVAPAVVAGHSMGGLVALAMAAAAPERVAALVLVNAGGVPLSERQLARVMTVVRHAHRVLSRPAVLRAIARRPRVRRVLLRGALRDPGAMRTDLAQIVVPLMAAPGFLDGVAAAGRAVQQARPEELGCPIHLIWGARDPLLPLRAARELQERMPGAGLDVLPDAGHSPMVEAPAAFTRALLRFTAELPR